MADRKVLASTGPLLTMRLHPTSPIRAARTAALATLCGLAACSGSLTVGLMDGGTGATGGSPASSGNSPTGSSATSASGGSAGATGRAATATGGTGSSTATSSGGSTTGGSSTGARIALDDGGYVYCMQPSAADAGPDGDGGPAAWMCRPGTYFCDYGGDIGNCFQCQSDTDCADQNLPTYDPNRPHCDVSSGVDGYQGYCQQCADNTDCTGNAAGSFCDLSPSYLFGALEPPIVTTGFEACGTLQSDCRLPGGPICNGYNQYCDSKSGVCLTHSGVCNTDPDCDGVLGLIYLSANTPAPFCVNGACASCAAGFNCQATCTSNGQCSSPFYPVCEGIGDGGSGICGCDTNEQCGDGGLACLPPPGIGISYCGIPCTSPQAPACSALCDPATGACKACASDQDCLSAPETAGNACLYGGNCGCMTNADCPAGKVCDFTQEVCIPALAPCTPLSCGTSFPEATGRGAPFCNWDSGVCQQSPSCLEDTDCTTGAPFCNADAGACTQCRTQLDCRHLGLGGPGCSPSGSCLGGCASDQDCVGSASKCLGLDSGYPSCGCGTDQDCVGNNLGERCDTDPSDNRYGSCVCYVEGDCLAGQTCPASGESSYCSGRCTDDSSCPANYFCDPTLICRPRCDTGHNCMGFDPACDVNNIGLQNGQTATGSSPGVTWCVPCVTASDCPAGMGCDSMGRSCVQCSFDAECGGSNVCTFDETCRPRCNAGACPNGEVCDTLGVTGYPDVCFACVSAADCPDGQGCNHYTHVCGTCLGPDSRSGSFDDCPPDAVCSSYWITNPYDINPQGVCLANCDRSSCPTSQPLCEEIPSLTHDHKYCVGCLHDSDCADAGAGAWCDVSVNFTFACQP